MKKWIVPLMVGGAVYGITVIMQTFDSKFAPPTIPIGTGQNQRMINGGIYGGLAAIIARKFI